MPIKKDRANARLRVLPLRAINSGMRAIHARKLKLNFGKEQIKKRAEMRAKRRSLGGTCQLVM